MGGSLTAGVRDDGYFDDGMRTSYAHLIARQMRVDSFRLPLFPDNQYNGFGRKLPTSRNPTGGPVAKYKTVNNNLGIEQNDTNPVVLSKLTGRIENYGIPGLTRFGLINNEYKEIEARFAPYLRRIAALNQLNKLTMQMEYNPLLKLADEKIDFYILETGLDDILDYALTGEVLLFQRWFGDTSNRPYEDTSYDSGPLQITRMLNKKGAKGCIATIPDILDLPYFNQPEKKAAEKYFSHNSLYARKTASKEVVPVFLTQDWLLPTPAVDSVLSNKISESLKPGISQAYPLPARSVLTQQNRSDLTSKTAEYNKEYLALAKKFNLVVVDLHALYKKIMSGTYTEEGVLVDPTFLKGNFFSSDGINPSPLGQAIIANEFIRNINTFYKTRIPLVSISHFARK